MLLYGCETWPMRVVDLHMLEVFDNDCLRCILRCRRINQVATQALRRHLSLRLLSSVLHQPRLGWFRHAARLPEGELIRGLLLAAPLPGWRKRTGGQLKTWAATFKDDLQKYETPYMLGRKPAQSAQDDSRDKYNEMPSKICKWLSLYKPNATESSSDIAWMYSNLRLIEDIEESLEKFTSSVLPDMFQRFYTFFVSSNADYKNFVLFFLPSLLTTQLSHPMSDDQRKALINSDSLQSPLLANITSLESCLIGICRHSLVSNTNMHLVNSTPSRQITLIPNLSDPCIFHDGLSHTPELVDSDSAPSFLTQSSSTEMHAVAFLIRCYVEFISSVDLLHSVTSFLSLHSLAQFCRLSDRISSLSIRPRISASSSLLTDLLVGLDIVLFKLDHVDKRTDEIRRTTLKIRESVWSSIHSIERRATYNCQSAPLLMCQAVMHSRPAQYGSRAAIGGKIPGGPPVYVDINSLITNAPELSTKNDTAETNKASVEMITNASFRPEAPPENIGPSEQDTLNVPKGEINPTTLNKSQLDCKGIVHFNAVNEKQRQKNGKNPP